MGQNRAAPSVEPKIFSRQNRNQKTERKYEHETTNGRNVGAGRARGIGIRGRTAKELRGSSGAETKSATRDTATRADCSGAETKSATRDTATRADCSGAKTKSATRDTATRGRLTNSRPQDGD